MFPAASVREGDCGVQAVWGYKACVKAPGLSGSSYRQKPVQSLQGALRS